MSLKEIFISDIFIPFPTRTKIIEDAEYLWKEILECTPMTERDPICGRRVGPEDGRIKMEMDGKTYYFCSRSCLNRFISEDQPSQRSLLSIILSKIFFELVAIGTSVIGILDLLQGTEVRALVMHTASAIAAIMAFIIGVENLRFMREHDLLRRAVLFLGAGILIFILVLVWHLGFHF